MVSLKNKKGFTIVELLIVIVVIGILATLVIVTFTGIQQKARNSERQTDINAVDSHVEAFHAQYGAYPTSAQLGNTAWRVKYMKGLDAEALVSPKKQNMGSSNTSTEAYWYIPTTDGSTACSGGTLTATAETPDVDTACAQFTLAAPVEGGGDPYKKSSN